MKMSLRNPDLYEAHVFILKLIKKIYKIDYNEPCNIYLNELDYFYIRNLNGQVHFFCLYNLNFRFINVKLKPQFLRRRVF